MEIIQKQVIELYESMSDNYKKSLKREFDKTKPVTDFSMVKRKFDLIFQLLIKINEVNQIQITNNTDIFSDLCFIEQILKSHIG